MKRSKMYALFLALSLGLSACGTSNAATTYPSEANQVSSKTASASTVPYDHLFVGQEALDSAVAAILGAKKTIDLDMYEFTNPQIINALMDAKKRGIQERVVLDVSSSNAAKELEQSQIPVHIEDVSGGINHVKYLAIDDQSVLLGSINFGKGSGKNEDASVWVPFKQDEQTFFDTVWQGKEPSIDGPTLFNRQSTQREAIRLINGAQKSIVIGMFSWTDHATEEAVIAAHKKGVNVSVYIDGHQQENAVIINQMRKSGVTVVVAHTQQWLHIKSLEVDGQTVLMGSANWTYHGFNQNHELNFETSSPNIATSIVHLLQETNQ